MMQRAAQDAWNAQFSLGQGYMSGAPVFTGVCYGGLGGPMYGPCGGCVFRSGQSLSHLEAMCSLVAT